MRSIAVIVTVVVGALLEGVRGDVPLNFTTCGSGPDHLGFESVTINEQPGEWARSIKKGAGDVADFPEVQHLLAPFRFKLTCRILNTLETVGLYVLGCCSHLWRHDEDHRDVEA
jgi:hypothetical protein